ncbi:MAG: hypothetical protein EGQ09_03895 [Clostridiales bacterium]|nr:hypothetical protein [Clostridiales bacterium]
MPTQVTEFKCPACTAPLHFSEETGRLECDYCGSSFSVEEMESRSAEKEQQAAEAFEKAAAEAKADAKDWDGPDAQDSWGEAGTHLKTYSCPSCGAELICDEATAATSCPYCGNNAIIPGQFRGALKPELVIPFQIGKDEAVKALKAHYKGKPFLPKSFSDENHIQEIKGIYVPFWLFDGQAEADVSFAATRSTVMVTGRERITTTRHFDVRRAGTVSFEKIPVDASKKMPDDYMDSLEPFRYDAMVPFSTAYLPGFFADIPDVSIEECSLRAELRATDTAVESMSRQVSGYETCVPTRKNAQLRRGKVRCALLPVWLLSTQWEGQNFLFAMNGQTGKMVSDLPVSKKRYWAWWGGLTAGITAALAVITVFANWL